MDMSVGILVIQHRKTCIGFGDLLLRSRPRLVKIHC